MNHSCVQNAAQLSLPPRGQLQSFIECAPLPLPPLPSADQQQLPQRPTAAAVSLRGHQSLCVHPPLPRQVLSGVSTLSAGSEAGIYQSLDRLTQQQHQQHQQQFVALTPDALDAGDQVVQLRSPPKSPTYNYMGASTLSSGHNSTLPEFVPPPPPQLEMPPEMQALSTANGQLVLAPAPSVNQLGVGIGQPNMYGFSIPRNSQVLNQSELAALLPSSGAPPLPPNRSTLYTPVLVNVMPPGSEACMQVSAAALTPRYSTPISAPTQAYMLIPTSALLDSGGVQLALDAAPIQNLSLNPNPRYSFALDASRPLSHLSNMSYPQRPAPVATSGSPQSSPSKSHQFHAVSSQPVFRNPRLLSQFGTGRALASPRIAQENGYVGNGLDAAPAPTTQSSSHVAPPPVAPRKANRGSGAGLLIGAQQDSLNSENVSDGQLESSAAAGMSELSELTEAGSTTADDAADSDSDTGRGAKPAAGTTSLNTSKQSSTRQHRNEAANSHRDGDGDGDDS